MATRISQKSYRADGSHATFNDSTISCNDGKFDMGILDGIQGMSIKESIDLGEEREAGSPFAEDVTTGDYSAEGTIDFKAEAWDRFKEKLNKKGIGHFGTAFDFTWTYRRKDNKTTSIVVKSAYFSERSRDGKTGNEALKVTLSFKIVGKGARLYENGFDAFGGKL